MIKLENIQLGYRKAGAIVPVFVPFCALAHRGELTALIGRNGKGKSTLLRCMAEH